MKKIIRSWWPKVLVCFILIFSLYNVSVADEDKYMKVTKINIEDKGDIVVENYLFKFKKMMTELNIYIEYVYKDNNNFYRLGVTQVANNIVVEEGQELKVSVEMSKILHKLYTHWNIVYSYKKNENI